VQEIDGITLESSLGLKAMDYVHPNEVVQDDRLPVVEKRTLLCAWASDACAVESRPDFRWFPGTPGPILVDHIFAALRALDDMADASRYAAYHEVFDGPSFSRTGRSGSAAGACA